MPEACSACDFAAEIDILKMQSLKNNALAIIGNFVMRKPTREIENAVRVWSKNEIKQA